MQMDLNVLGGIPVTVEYNISGADPDVGVMSAGVDEWWISHINGRKVKNPTWLYKRIDGKKGEEDKILETLNLNCSEPHYYEWD